jgi:uncharacterized protein YgiM (DUF1202 family)
MTRKQAIWLLVTGALSFAVAACASQQGAPSQPGGTTAAQRKGGQEQGAASSAQATPPGSTSQSQGQRQGAARTPLGDRVEIRKSWVQVRSKPSPDAAAIALAFGNDTYPVLETQGDWVRVRIDGNREGWIPVEATREQ